MNINFNNYCKTFLGITLLVSTSVLNAALYIKGFGSNTNTNMEFESDYPFVSALSDNFTKQHNLVSHDNIGGGVAIGYDYPVHRKLRLGFEISGHTFGDFEYVNNFPVGDSALVEDYDIETRTDNRYKLVGAFTVKLNNAFFIKIGPSLLRQQVEQTLYENTPRPILLIPLNKENTNIYGTTIGAGFIYRLTRAFGIYTEYNFSSYARKGLQDISVPDAFFAQGLNGLGGDYFTANKRKVKFSQNEFFLGFQYGE